MALRIPESTPTLELERVLLRPFCAADVEGRQRLGRDPAIQLGFGANPSYDQWQPMEEAAAQAWYDSQLALEGPFVWALDFEGRLIGSCRLHSVERADERARYAIGMLDRDLLGQGLGAEITNGVLAYAFNTAGIHRIDLRVLASNQRAVACYQKCGFVIEGRERESAKIGDRREDDLIMGLLSSERVRTADGRAKGGEMHSQAVTAEPYLTRALPFYADKDVAHGPEHVVRLQARVVELAPDDADLDLPYLWFLVAYHGLVPRLADDGFAGETTDFLATLGWTRVDADDALAGLRRHTTSPARLEEELVHDANLLEVIGALGVAKAFTRGGADRQTYEETLRIFEQNLEKARFATGVGRREAEAGREYARAFIQQLRTELDMEALPTYPA